MPFVQDFPEDDTARVDGEPFYALTRYTLSQPPGEAPLSFCLRAFRTLPLSDAAGLLERNDETGLIVWSGSLALIEWLRLEQRTLKSFLSGASADGYRVVAFLELGSGSGVLSVGIGALLSTMMPLSGLSFARITATDGNASCVQLSTRNLEHQIRSGWSSSIRTSTSQFHWGGCSPLLGALVTDDPTTVVSADVIYALEAVPLIFQTVHALLTASNSSATASGSSDSRGAFQWWLVYKPRGMTRASNEQIFEKIVAEIRVRPTWRVSKYPLPENSYTTEFDSGLGAMDASYALSGCIFIMKLR